MKLGKKLEVTSPAARAALLEAGEVFYSNAGLNKIYYHSKGSGSPFRIGDEPLTGSWNDVWHCPAKTYTLHGVELVDERAGRAALNEAIGLMWMVDLSEPDGVVKVGMNAINDKHFERDLIHRNYKAGRAHAMALLGIHPDQKEGE